MQKQMQRQESRFIIESNGRRFEIYIPDKTMTQAEAERTQSPEGYRRLMPREGCIAWRTNEGFRQDLCENSGVWTGQKGLKSSQYQKVNRENGSAPLSVRDFENLPIGEKSYYIRGNGLVLLRSYNGADTGLFINANIGPTDPFRVAYVRDLGKAEKQKSAGKLKSTELRRKAQQELDALSKFVKPEVISALIQIFRRS